MRARGWGFIFVCLLCASSGCGEWGRELPEHIVARVNEESVTAEEFNEEFQELILEPGTGKKWINPGDLKKAYLDQMIERKILVQEAQIRHQGFTGGTQSGDPGDQEGLPGGGIE
jgi:hypothetical protein